MLKPIHRSPHQGTGCPTFMVFQGRLGFCCPKQRNNALGHDCGFSNMKIWPHLGRQMNFFLPELPKKPSFSWGLHELSNTEDELITLCPSSAVFRATTRKNEWPIWRPFGGISGIILSSAHLTFPPPFQVMAWFTVICSGKHFNSTMVIVWPLWVQLRRSDGVILDF